LPVFFYSSALGHFNGPTCRRWQTGLSTCLVISFTHHLFDTPHSQSSI